MNLEEEAVWEAVARDLVWAEVKVVSEAPASGGVRSVWGLMIGNRLLVECFEAYGERAICIDGHANFWHLITVCDAVPWLVRSIEKIVCMLLLFRPIFTSAFASAQNSGNATNRNSSSDCTN